LQGKNNQELLSCQAPSIDEEECISEAQINNAILIRAS
jgi:hypothetical protein